MRDGLDTPRLYIFFIKKNYYNLLLASCPTMRCDVKDVSHRNASVLRAPVHRRPIGGILPALAGSHRLRIVSHMVL